MHLLLFLPSEVNHETLNLLKYVRPGGGFVPKFPVFGKIEVNGLNEEPLFAYLKVVYLTCPYALLCTALWGQVEYLMDIRPH